MTLSSPDCENSNDQELEFFFKTPILQRYNCPRDWRENYDRIFHIFLKISYLSFLHDKFFNFHVSRYHGGPIKEPPETLRTSHSTMLSRGLRGALNWAPIMWVFAVRYLRLLNFMPNIIAVTRMFKLFIVRTTFLRAHT